MTKYLYSTECDPKPRLVIHAKTLETSPSESSFSLYITTPFQPGKSAKAYTEFSLCNARQFALFFLLCIYEIRLLISGILKVKRICTGI